MFKIFKYIFCENGLVAYQNTKLEYESEAHNIQPFHKQNILNYLGSDCENKYQKIINIILKKLIEIEIPIKRGTFIELRSSCINVSPIGRSCTYQERIDFNDYDKIHKFRENLINSIKNDLLEYGLKCSIGGMISIDIIPIGWDKTYCLNFLGDYDKYSLK